MHKIVSIHSFRRGTGKTHTTANLAALVAMTGRRVGVVDANVASPGIHILLGLDERRVTFSLNDYMSGKCKIRQAAYDLSGRVGAGIPGHIFLVPASVRAAEIQQMQREGYDVGMLNDGLYNLVESLDLDILLIDTQPGLNEETIMAMAVSDMLLLIMRLDLQDYRGTSMVLDVARRLDVPETMLVLNMVPACFASSNVKAEMEKAFDAEVAAVLPHSDAVAALASKGVFAIHFPAHSVTAAHGDLVERLLG